MSDEYKLLEKIIRAKIALEGAHKSHTCMIDLDPDYMGPCKCSAGEHNAKIDRALDALKL